MPNYVEHIFKNPKPGKGGNLEENEVRKLKESLESLFFRHFIAKIANNEVWYIENDTIRERGPKKVFRGKNRKKKWGGEHLLRTVL